MGSTQPDIDLSLKGYILAGTLSVVVYDYLCTFDQEVEYVWKPKWTFGSTLFLVNRYLPFVDLGFCLSMFKSVLTPEECHTRFEWITWLTLVGISVSEVIVILRTIALWNRRKDILVILIVVFGAALGACVFILQRYLRSLQFLPIAPIPGCYLVNVNKIFFLNYVIVLFCETAIVVLTMIRAFHHLRHSNSRSSWVFQLYQRGFVFYLYLLGVTLLNVIFPVLAPVPRKTLFSDPQRALHSICCNRVIFIILSHRYNPPNMFISSRIPGSERSETFFSTILDTFATEEEREDDSEEESTTEQSDHDMSLKH